MRASRSWYPNPTLPTTGRAWCTHAKRDDGFVSSPLPYAESTTSRIAYPSFGQALWQGFLSRGDAGAFSALEAAAAGGPLSRVLADHRAQVERATTAPQPAHPVWSFISSAPSGKPSTTT